jgi:translation initiation factor 1 (eIF-1/SUI1)
VQGAREEVVRRGAIKNIEVRMEDKFGGRKHATKLSHVESFALNPEELAGALQRKFQVSATIFCNNTSLPLLCIEQRR